MSRDERRLIYSTGPEGSVGNRTSVCAGCGKAPCVCEPSRSEPAEVQQVRVRRERGGRRGKTVTVAGPIRLVRADATTLLKQLKKRCGAGGTLKRCEGTPPAFEIEIQGDQVETVVGELTGQGYSARRSGG